jgi:hypothetical protein
MPNQTSRTASNAPNRQKPQKSLTAKNPKNPQKSQAAKNFRAEKNSTKNSRPTKISATTKQKPYKL